MDHDESRRSQNNYQDSSRRDQSEVSSPGIFGRQASPLAIAQRVAIDPFTLAPADVMQLQKALGNEAVGKLLETAMAQLIRADAPDHRAAEIPLQKRENQNGMQDSLKTGLESLSGIDISEVRAYYNSDQPIEIGALVNKQGMDIQTPGQERQVPFEEWHELEQRQGKTLRLQSIKPIQGYFIYENHKRMSTDAIEKIKSLWGDDEEFIRTAKNDIPFNFDDWFKDNKPEDEQLVFNINKIAGADEKEEDHEDHSDDMDVDEDDEDDEDTATPPTPRRKRKFGTDVSRGEKSKKAKNLTDEETTTTTAEAEDSDDERDKNSRYRAVREALAEIKMSKGDLKPYGSEKRTTKTMYGYTSGTGRQGPHTVAHITAAVIIAAANSIKRDLGKLRNTAAFPRFRRVVHMFNKRFDDIGEERRKGKARERKTKYLKAYKEARRLSKPDKPEETRLKALFDGMELCPATVYHGAEGKATHDELQGKGERRKAAVDDLVSPIDGAHVAVENMKTMDLKTASPEEKKDAERKVEALQKLLWEDKATEDSGESSPDTEVSDTESDDEEREKG